MTDEEKTFHELYWLGACTMTFKDIANEMKMDVSDMSKLCAKTKDARERTKSLRQRWLSKFSTDERPRFGDFLKILDALDDKCCYCGITQTQIDMMYEQGLVETKRSRGTSLEIERMAPNEPYNKSDNLNYACYWCNNAKTDSFSYEEFKNIIAPGIRTVWNCRLKEAGLELIPEEPSEKYCPSI